VFRPTPGAAIRRLAARPAARVAALAALILLAIVLPRAAALRGISVSSNLEFGDMPQHLLNLDKLAKLHAGLDRQPYYRAHPEARTLFRPARWPGGVYQVALPWARTFGTLSIWTVQLTNLLFTLVLVAGVIGLGVALGGDLRHGLWAALLVVLCPALVGASWYLSLDYPLVAMTTVGLLLLHYTEGLTRWRFCLLLAVWSALGMSVKMTYSLYLVGPALLALAEGLHRPGLRLRALALSAGASVICLALLFTMQDATPREVLNELTMHSTVNAYSMKVEAWSATWAAAVAVLALGNFPLPLLLLALPGVVGLHLVRRARPVRWLLLGLLWGGYLMLTLLPHKMERYGLPLYPICCLLTVWWLLQVIGRRWRLAALIWAVALYCGVLYLAHLRPPPWVFCQEGDAVNLGAVDLRMPGRKLLAQLRKRTFHPDCRMQSLMRHLAELSRADGRTSPLGIAVSWPPGEQPPPYINAATLATHVIRDRIIEEETGLTRFAQVQPTVIAVHPPDVEPLVEQPQLRLLQRRTHVLHCGDQLVHMYISLYRAGP